MQASKKPIIPFLIVFMMGLLTYQPITLAETDTPTASEGDWPGLYHAILPCEDCKGVKSTLALNKNGSYVLTREYLAKSPREFVEKGKFTWNEAKDTITLTPKKGSTTAHQFVIGENMLTQLDQNGELHAGELANQYIFRRHDVTRPRNGHEGH